MNIKNYLKNTQIKNFFIYSSGQMLFGIIAFLLLPMYSKELSTEEYGLLNLLLLFVLFAKIVIDAGLTTVINIRYFQIDLKKRAEIIFNSTIFYTVFIVILFIIFFLFPQILSKLFKTEISREVQMLTCGVVLANLFSSLMLSIIRLEEKAGTYVALSSIKAVINGVCNIVLLLVFNLGYTSYLFSIIVSQLFILFYFIKYLFNMIARYKPVLKLNTLKSLLRIGYPLIPNSLLLLVITSGDRLILTSLLTPAVVGIYSMAYKFGEIIENFFNIPFASAISPKVYREFAKGFDFYKQFILSVMNIYALSATFVFTLLMVFVDFYFNYFIDVKYASSLKLVPIISISLLVNGFMMFLNSIIILKEKTKLLLLISTICAITNVGLNYLLIPVLQELGAALATLCSYLLVLMITNHLAKKYSEFQYFKYKTIFLISSITVIFTILTYKSVFHGFSLPFWIFKLCFCMVIWGIILYVYNNKVNIKEFFNTVNE